MNTSASRNKRILVIVSWAYNRRELWVTLKGIKKSGWNWTILSAKGFIEEERTRAERFTCIKLSDFSLDIIKDYAGLVVVSGYRTTTEFLYYDEKTRAIVKKFALLDKPIAAMCAAVPVIRDVLHGKTVTAFPSSRVLPLLRKAGATITEETLFVDGLIVTAKTDEITERMMTAFIDLIQREVPDNATEKSQASLGDL